MDDLTILVVSPDSFSDLWKYFFACKEKYWKDCPFTTILSNNILRPKINNLKIINNGKNAEWSERTKNALLEIKTKYVCFFVEELFISDYVDTQYILDIINFMNLNKLKYYKLFNLNRINTPLYKNINFLHEINASYPYGLSLMPSIWEKEYFISKIGEGNYRPWKFELDRLKEEKQCKDPKEIIGVFDDRNILHIVHMLAEGLYIPESLKKMKKIGINISLKERGKLEGIQYFKFQARTKISSLLRKYPFLKFIFFPLKNFSRQNNKELNNF